MSHSVSRHLRIDVAAYDRMVRQFIPSYEVMLSQAVDTVATIGPGRVLDLGAGTGALSELLLQQASATTVELWDVDDEMLAVARDRLTRFGPRAIFRRRSFSESFPSVDAMMASLALHHVRELNEKTALYQRIADALTPRGVLVNADIVIPTDPVGRDATYRDWAGRMAVAGIPEDQAWRHFEEWRQEDRYFSLDEELGALAAAGLQPECIWRDGPGSVVAGWKR